MPRKSKDELKEPNNTILEKDKKTSSKKSEKNSKVIGKKETVKAEKTAKVDKTTTKSTGKITKNTKTAKPASGASKTIVRESIKATSNSTKKRATQKTTTKRKTNANKENVFLSNIEYYDLPYRYNQTVVKILAQTPTMLFIYWDISDEDRKSYMDKYGNDFFNHTKPVLKITNKTMNYSFEIDINDFANSWYLHVNDADCDYSVELGRIPIVSNSNIENYVYVSTSNDMEMPNNHILFDKLGKSVFFRNIKNNFVEEREVSSLSFIRNLGKVYDIYELYKEMYNGEISIDDIGNGTMRLNLSSSSSSTFK